MVSACVMFLGRFISFYFRLFSYILGVLLNVRIIPLALVRYEVIMVNYGPILH